jgi:hypothetical protein
MGDWRTLVFQQIRDHNLTLVVAVGGKREKGFVLCPLDNPSLWAI